MNTIKEKLTSRKFWACLVGVVTGLGAMFGLEENIITETAGMVTALASIVSYIWTEGKIDAARMGQK